MKVAVSSLKGCAVHEGTACALKERGALLLEAPCSEFVLSSFERSQVLAQGWLLPKGIVSFLCHVHYGVKQQLQKMATDSSGFWNSYFFSDSMLAWN